MKTINLNYQGRDLKKAIVVNPGEEMTLVTESVYDKPHQTGEVLVKAVVMENAVLNIKGIIKIQKGANLSEGFLRQSVLLVGDNSRAEAKPELEIECDEVKASHAASVGRIDEEQLFYLQSRGLNRAEAEKLIIDAFLVLS